MRTDTSPGRTGGTATVPAASSPGAVSTMAFMAADPIAGSRLIIHDRVCRGATLTFLTLQLEDVKSVTSAGKIPDRSPVQWGRIPFTRRVPRRLGSEPPIVIFLTGHVANAAENTV